MNEEQSKRLNALFVQYFLEMNRGIKQMAEDNQKKNKLIATTLILLSIALLIILVKLIILKSQ